MRTVVVANQKGGVGKSAIATHLAFAAVEAGRRVLVVDMDAQSTTTNNLLTEVPEGASQGSGLFDGTAGEGDLVRTADGIAVITGDRALSAVDEHPEADERQPAAWLARLYGQAFDICIIDPPPTLGKRLRAALIASDFVVMPFMPVRESTDGLGQLLETINLVREHVNPRLEYVGLQANKVNPRSSSQQRVLAQVREFAGDLLLPALIVERAAVSDALAQNRPVWRGMTGESSRKAADEMRKACEAILGRVVK